MSAFDPRAEDQSDVDREIRVEKMKRELDDFAGGPMISGGFGQVSPSLEEVFLERVCEIEKGSWDTNFNRLVRLGVAMVPPTELDVPSTQKKLKEVIHALASLRCFLEQTDHLSDRELYEWLWSEGLREETPDLTHLADAWHTSPIGSGNEEDTAIFLKFYASEKERRHWKEQFLVDALPPKCALPYRPGSELAAVAITGWRVK